MGRSILIIAYYVLLLQEPYESLGVDYFEGRNREAQERRLFRQAQALGFTITRDQPVA